MTEQELWKWMWEGQYPPEYEDLAEQLENSEQRRATATLKMDVVGQGWNGHYPPKGQPEHYDIPLPAGSKVKVVMVSRLGDVGITNDLGAHHGYIYRTQCVKGCFLGVEFVPGDLLENIQPIRKTGL